MIVNFSINDFRRQLDNLVDYSVGFLEGAEYGKKIFLENLGKGTIEALKLYVDAMARSNPQMLHHVYEWNQIGSKNARLFDVSYSVSNIGLSIFSNFKQSQSVKNGSNVPFYNKAKIMEIGQTITIKPKNSKVLVFTNSDGESVFTKKKVTVKNPGGLYVQGSYEETFDNFMKFYFTQSFLSSSGIYDYLKTPKIYKENLKAGIKGGSSVGKTVGFKWITNAKVGVE